MPEAVELPPDGLVEFPDSVEFPDAVEFPDEAFVWVVELMLAGTTVILTNTPTRVEVMLRRRATSFLRLVAFRREKFPMRIRVSSSTIEGSKNKKR